MGSNDEQLASRAIGRGVSSFANVGAQQVSTKANNSSNIPVGCIDSQPNRRYSLAQIPNLVAYANPRLHSKAQSQGLTLSRARGLRSVPVFTLRMSAASRG